jgi:16S rRNA (guanine(1405)-N(7))-methyltransferase
MTDSPKITELIAEVRAGRKYSPISTDLIRRLAEATLQKGLTGKAAVKDVRNKLHQVGGAYFKQTPDYEKAISILSSLPGDYNANSVRQFCRSQMSGHASTAERLPILEDFFQTCLAPIAPVTSILDLACGLTPLSLPWMPLGEHFTYHACDIYANMLAFVQSFFDHCRVDGKAQVCDLIGKPPLQQAQVAFLLKTIPCLEQVDKQIGLPLLESIRADHILVSFPAASLGGRRKGMPAYYRDHFLGLIEGKAWSVSEFSFDSELAFLVTK